MALRGLISARDVTSCFPLHFSWVLLFQSAHLRSCQEPPEKRSHRGSLHTFELSTESPRGGSLLSAFLSQEPLAGAPRAPQGTEQQPPRLGEGEIQRALEHQGTTSAFQPKVHAGGQSAPPLGFIATPGGACLWVPWSCGLWKAQAGRGTGGCPGGGCNCASQLTLPWERRAPSFLSAAVGVDQVDRVSPLPRAGRLSAPLRRQGSVLTARGHPLARLPIHRRNGPRADAYPLLSLPGYRVSSAHPAPLPSIVLDNRPPRRPNPWPCPRVVPGFIRTGFPASSLCPFGP